MQIIVYGHDYPALVTAASLATNGNQVALYPVDAPNGWQWQDTASKQSGLTSLVQQQLDAGQLNFLVGLDCPCIPKAHIHILSVQSAQVETAQMLVQQLLPLLGDYSLLVTQSMQGVGRAAAYQALFDAQQRQVAVVVWPDFMSEGSAIGQFSRPDRIILGATQTWAIDRMRDLLRPYNRARDMLLIMSPAAAELTKYAINSLLALRVSAMNEFANLAEAIGVDIEQVRQGIGTDPRIGFNYLYPGAGFGGPNFMADLNAMVNTFYQHGQTPRLLPAALAVNQDQQEILFSKMWQYYAAQLSGKTFALWGVSYKPDTATIEQASSLRLIDALLAQNVTLRIHDPKALTALAAHYTNHPNIVLCSDPYQACEGSQALLIMTEWKVYWNPDFDRIKALLTEAVIFDGRNIYGPQQIAEHGVVYLGVGRCNISL
ncbi:MAG: nucleotide sugar dehydrogenase [Proteobacteria bacterium]|nr:nucleotide sugar dehydrogenase [Pseudomonadota bacterium]